MEALKSEVNRGPLGKALEPEALQVLLVSERSHLLAYICKHFPSILSPLVEPHDILQDTYFEAARRMTHFIPADETSVFRLLVTIARRRIAQLLRIRGRVKHGGKSRRVAQSDSIVATLAELAMHSKTPSRSAAGHEFMAALQRSLETLPEDIRAAVTLRYMQGMSPQEIAGRLNRSERAVHQLCYRGLQQVRRDLRSASHFR